MIVCCWLRTDGSAEIVPAVSVAAGQDASKRPSVDELLSHPWVMGLGGKSIQPSPMSRMVSINYAGLMAISKTSKLT